MATTKIFPISATVGKAITYIASKDKTDNGKLISTFMCNRDPAKAAKDFSDMTATGTGKSSVLAQHFIISFKPGEVTPERALEIGKEICEKFLQDQYQYYLAVHNDREHIHIHCIFNNTNMISGRTFQTLNNQGKVSGRMWKKLRVLSDEVCKHHHLSVIDHPENNKGISHWEWDMERQGVSWKAKLKYAIDKVIKESDDFEDFLKKCKAHGIIADYNPDHKIDLKFMLAEQKERNPRAKMTRARTLGWYYETNQIKSRISQYKGGMAYVPRIKVRHTVTKQENKFVRDAIDRGNMKLASIAKNIITQYGVEPEHLRGEAMLACAQWASLTGDLNTLQTQIEDYKAQLKVIRQYRKVKSVQEELKNLSGRQAQKFRKEHNSELKSYGESRSQILEWYPDGHIPAAELLEQKINALIGERLQKNDEYKSVKKKAEDLSKAQRTIEEFLRNEREVQEQKRRKNKNGDLE